MYYFSRGGRVKNWPKLPSGEKVPKIQKKCRRLIWTVPKYILSHCTLLDHAWSFMLSDFSDAWSKWKCGKLKYQIYRACGFFCKSKPWRCLQAFNKFCLPQIVLATKPYYVYVYFMMFVATTANAHQ